MILCTRYHIKSWHTLTIWLEYAVARAWHAAKLQRALSGQAGLNTQDPGLNFKIQLQDPVFCFTLFDSVQVRALKDIGSLKDVAVRFGWVEWLMIGVSILYRPYPMGPDQIWSKRQISLKYIYIYIIFQRRMAGGGFPGAVPPWYLQHLQQRANAELAVSNWRRRPGFLGCTPQPLLLPTSQVRCSIFALFYIN